MSTAFPFHELYQRENLTEDGAAIMRAVWGRSYAEFSASVAYEEVLEQQRRPHVFVRKLHSRRTYAPQSGTGPQTMSRTITENEFASVYAAADFAYQHGLWLDTHITLSWSRLGAGGEQCAQKHFLNFTKCVRDWLKHKHLPYFSIYGHEHGSAVGLHTHFLLHLPAPKSPSVTARRYRSEFRRWAKHWPERQGIEAAPGAMRITGPATETPWLHWPLIHYLLKGYDQHAVVIGARNAPDGRQVMLGDLIAYPWRDPGPVRMEQRVGSSKNLGPAQRALGVPGGLVTVPKPARFELIPNSGVFCTLPQTTPPQYPAFRSAYEDGVRDVRRLYPIDFWQRVTRMIAAD